MISHSGAATSSSMADPALRRGAQRRSGPGADAQSFDQAGTRAKGMGGAFVAVADDATATWWNPAGVPNSFVVDAVLDVQAAGFTDKGWWRRTGPPARATVLPDLHSVSLPLVQLLPRPSDGHRSSYSGGRSWPNKIRRQVRLPGLLTEQFGVAGQSLGDGWWSARRSASCTAGSRLRRASRATPMPVWTPPRRRMARRARPAMWTWARSCT